MPPFTKLCLAQKFLIIFCIVAHNKVKEGLTIMENQKWHPGEEAPASGTYAAYDKFGQCGGAVYLEEGERFPATQHEGSYYQKQD